MATDSQFSSAHSGAWRYALTTRLWHASLATAIVLQLMTSLVMHGPGRDRAGDWLFEIHEYSGLVALVLALGFWLHVLRRRTGTSTRTLVPWFNAERRGAVRADIKTHWIALKARRIPVYEDTAPLATAIHGLGLLLMLGMATTGTVFFVGLYFGIQKTGLFPLDLDVHKLLANLAWAYLVGHAGMAMLHHYWKHSSLSEMWAFRKDE